MATETLPATTHAVTGNWACSAVGILSDASDATFATASVTPTGGYLSGTVVTDTARNSAVDTFNSIAMVVRGRYVLGGSVNLRVEVYDGTSWGDAGFIASWTTVISTVTLTVATKPSGGAWTTAAVNALQFRISEELTDSSTLEIQEAYAQLDYTAGGGGATLHTVPMMGAGLL